MLGVSTNACTSSSSSPARTLRSAQLVLPHVFQIDDGAPLRVAAGQTLDLPIVLVVDANAACRGPVLVERGGSALPGVSEPSVSGSRGRLAAADPRRAPVTPSCPPRVRIELLSPHKASGNGRRDGINLACFS